MRPYEQYRNIGRGDGAGDRGYRGSQGDSTGDRGYRAGRSDGAGDRGYRGRGGVRGMADNGGAQDRQYERRENAGVGRRFGGERSFDSAENRKVVQQAEELRAQLRAIDHRGYPAYKSLAGSYRFPSFLLSIDHVQGDPFASPSHLSVFVPHRTAGFDAALYGTQERRTALEDYLLRRFGREAAEFNFRAKGSGKSGLLSVSRPGQEILARTAAEITEEGIWLRFHVGFPANGRTINAGELEKILFDFIPACVKRALVCASLPAEELKRTAELADDQANIRAALAERGLVAFVADGAVLPRRSGVSDLPMQGSVRFSAPETLRVTLELPHRGALTGMGIPAGITLITGGGYHGKSTLLKALEMGVYNHIAGDGREYVITDAAALKLRAEDGRFIDNTDISLFINDLPNKKDTAHFSTEDASGSTSQAAGIVEGIFAGCRALLIDEDTSAANFMVRDALMQRIVNRDKEPITPFIERARQLHEQLGISTVLVAGSSGAFFHIADTVIQMDNYRALDITARVREVLRDEGAVQEKILIPSFRLPQEHVYRAEGGRIQDAKVKVFDRDSFAVDKNEVNLHYVEQLADQEQTAALAYILRYVCTKLAAGAGSSTISGGRLGAGLDLSAVGVAAEEACRNGLSEETARKKAAQDGAGKGAWRGQPGTLSQLLDELALIWREQGFAAFMRQAKGGGYTASGFACPRMQEVYACLARYRR